MPNDLLAQNNIDIGNDLFAQNGISHPMPETGVPPSAPQSQSWSDNLANSPGIQGLLGAGDAMRGSLADAMNLIPGVNVPNPKFGSGAAYNIGNFAGNAATFIGGGEGLDALRGASEATPYLGAISKFLGSDSSLAGGLKRALGTGTYGAATSPDNRTGGGEMGSALSIASDFLPPGARIATQAAQAFRPEQYADQLLQTLGGGKTLEENQQALGANIQGAYQKQAGAGSALYNPIFDSVGNSSIYDSVRNPAPNNFQNIDQITEHMSDVTGKDFDDEDDVKDYLNSKYNANLDSNKDLLNYFNSAPNSSGTRATSQYLNLDSDATSGYDRNLNKMHDQFIDNPTFNNAHLLQSQLGSSIRDLQSNTNRTVADTNTMQGYQDAQSAIKSDMSKFLENNNPGMSQQYDQANHNWATNVAPYLNNPKIAAIAKGEITNPDNIMNIFSSPEDDTKKIVSDIGQQANNSILYSQLGKYQGKSAQKLSDAISDLDKNGIGSYVNPQIQQGFDTLSSKISYRNNLQRVVGGAAGLAALHPSWEAAGIATTAGAAASPYVMSALQKILPIRSGAKGLSGLAQYGYSPVSRAVIGNLAKGNQ